MNCVTQSALPIALHFWQFSATWSVAAAGSRTEIAGGGLGRGEGGGQWTLGGQRKQHPQVASHLHPRDCYHSPPLLNGEW